MEQMFAELRNHVHRFAYPSEADWIKIKAYFRPYFLNGDDHLVQMGSVCNHIYFVYSGSLRMYYLEGGKDVTRFFALEGQFASALTSFLTRQPSLENIQALEDTELLCLNYEDLQTLYSQVPAWQELGRKLLENAYVISTRIIESLICLDATQRYLNLLETAPDILQRVPQIHIATYLGVEPETLSRIRRKVSQRTTS